MGARLTATVDEARGDSSNRLIFVLPFDSSLDVESLSPRTQAALELVGVLKEGKELSLLIGNVLPAQGQSTLIDEDALLRIGDHFAARGLLLEDLPRSYFAPRDLTPRPMDLALAEELIQALDGKTTLITSDARELGAERPSVHAFLRRLDSAELGALQRALGLEPKARGPMATQVSALPGMALIDGKTVEAVAFVAHLRGIDLSGPDATVVESLTRSWPAWWSNHAPVNGPVQADEDGDLIDGYTQEILNRATWFLHEVHGRKDVSFTVTQGSYNDGVSASGGTHDEGGALDIHTASHDLETRKLMLLSLRQAGGAAWLRGEAHSADPFDPHIHMIAIGHPDLSPQAASQVADYAAGQNGLANGARDADAFYAPGPENMPNWAKSAVGLG